jgi:hypothetical protein
VRAPIALSDLVADQAIAGRCIRSAEQRFGEAHERDAFARIQREFEHQRIDAARLVAFRAHALRQRRGKRLCRAQCRLGQCGLGNERGYRVGLGTTIVGGDSRTKGVERKVGSHARSRCGEPSLHAMIIWIDPSLQVHNTTNSRI